MTNTESVEKLLKRLGDELEGKEASEIIPALTLLIANAGVMSGADQSALLTYIALTITRVYEENGPSEIVN
jgi:hypothetical protein